MNVARTKPRRGTRPALDAAATRVPEEHEEGRRSSVAELAYRLFEERGRQHGHQLEDWLEAERQISNRRESTEEVHA